ncbi:MAG: hypothetical protein LBM99_02515 [Bacillales bacterium]|jgi:hypothetical protein|nr:hypothetical protein [Bacillales bacterium]
MKEKVLSVVLLALSMFLFLLVFYVGRDHFLIPFLHINFKSIYLYIFLISAMMVVAVWVLFFVKKTQDIAFFMLKYAFVFVFIFIMFMSLLGNMTYSYTSSLSEYMHISNQDKAYMKNNNYFDLFPANTDKGTLDFYFYYSETGFLSDLVIDFTIIYDNETFYNEEVDRLNIFSVNHQLRWDGNMAYYSPFISNRGFVLNEEGKSIKYFLTRFYGKDIYYEQYIKHIKDEVTFY